MAEDTTTQADAETDEVPVSGLAKYKRDENDRVIYPLKRPFQFGERTVSELRFREPETGDIDGIPLAAMTTTHLIRVAGKICGEPQPVMNKVKLADIVEIGELIMDFLPDGLLTGLMR